ncbi:type II secretion system F family protein [Aquicella lusitana]|uniref:Type II secretory pathway component PulF n=1 Tax=Aquicella lusitana TaxID=254246 RepID=A0A370GS66_9COXI|nr:type II secretion system F family protein [Aquicella lusitana]RDI46537.1 type II secretory pathway component PulF [Aquicella lusitana]VVC74201.1 Toxin coregulated pilus biosynthesis protein E [Aquicella lusitana]
MELSFDELKNIGSKVTLAFKRWQFGNKAQLAFLEDLYTLINDGIPANRAVDMMAQVTHGLRHEVAVSLSEKIAQGQPLADGMKEWFSMNVVEIIRVGEAGGALAQTIKSAINMLSQRGVAMGAFVGAVTYPLIVLFIACAVIVYLNESVFVQFRAIKPIEMWPESGRRLVTVANVIQSWWWLVILAVVVVVVILRWLMINYTGELRPTLDKIPPFSFYKRFVSSRMLETLGLLVANGVVFKSAIKVMQYQANPYLNSHLVMIEHLLGMGKTNIGDVLDTGLIENQDLMRLRVMAEVKGFEHGLVRMGVRGTEQATATLKLISRIVGGALLAVGAVLIIIIIQGIYLTGMSMGTA